MKRPDRLPDGTQPFVQIKESVHRGIDHRHLGMWVILRSYANHQTLVAWPSIRTLTTHADASHNTVQKHINALEAEGWLCVSKGNAARPDGKGGFKVLTGRQVVNHYHLHEHADKDCRYFEQNPDATVRPGRKQKDSTPEPTTPDIWAPNPAAGDSA